MAVAHYLEALAWQRDVASCTPSSAAKTRTPTSGRRRAVRDQPEFADSRHQRRNGGLSQVQDIINTDAHFVDQVYVPDTLAIAGFYKDWGTGEGVGNFLTYGDFPEKGMDDPACFLIPPA